jgi:hypothetical protein
LYTGCPPGLQMPFKGAEHSGNGPYWQQSLEPGVGVGLGVRVTVGVSVGVELRVEVGVCVGVRLGVGEAVGVRVAVGVGVTVKVAQTPEPGVPCAMHAAWYTATPPELHIPSAGAEQSGKGPYWQQSFGPGVGVGVAVGVGVRVGVTVGVRVMHIVPSHTALGTRSQPPQPPLLPGSTHRGLGHWQQSNGAAATAPAYVANRHRAATSRRAHRRARGRSAAPASAPPPCACGPVCHCRWECRTCVDRSLT